MTAPRADARRRGLAVARVPLLVLGFVGLVFGVGAGLARLAVPLPATMAASAAQHGPLMIGAFFGVVISLERAVALRSAWAYAAPLVGGLGGLCIVAGALPLAPWLLLVASAVLLAATLVVAARQPAMFTLTLALGALAWAAGNAWWAAGGAPYEAVPLWLAFLILTIAGERLELSRLMPPSRVAKSAFVAIVGVLGVALAASATPWSRPLFAAGLLALAAWLARNDIARRTVRGKALTRYIAVCLLCGYFWLAAGALIALVGGFAPGSAAYDAALHAIALGFVFSMVLGHAPIIVPAVLRVDVPYRTGFYVPLAMLHASLVARLAGDALAAPAWTRAGAVANAVALAAFILTMAGAAVAGRRRTAGRAPV